MNILKKTQGKSKVLCAAILIMISGLYLPTTASAHGWWRRHCYNCYRPQHWRHNYWRRHWRRHYWRTRTVYNDNGAALGAVALGVGLVAGAAIIANNQQPTYTTVVQEQPHCFITKHHGEYFRVCKHYD